MKLRRRTTRSIAACLLALCAVSADAAITVSKSIAPGYSGNINPGDTTAFRITLSNDNAGSNVNSVDFTDDMSGQNIQVAGVGLVSNTCSGSVNAIVGATSIALTGGVIPIAPGGGSLGSCDIVVEVTSTVQSTRTNTIAAGAVTGNDGAPVSNGTPASQSFNVLPMTAPTLGKSFSPATVVQSSGTSQLTLTLSNPNGSATIPLTTVTDSLPAGMEVAGTPAASASCTGTGAANPAFTPSAGDTTLIVTGGTIGRSGACTIRVNVIATSAGASGSQTLTNTLLAGNVGNTRGLTPGANASANLVVNSPLSVAKAYSPTALRANQSGAGTLTFTVTNAHATQSLSNLAFSEANIWTSASGAGSLSVTGGSTTCSGGSVSTTATGFSLTGGTLAAGASCTVTLTFTGNLAIAGTPETFSDQLPAAAISNTEGYVSRISNTTSVTVSDQLTVSKSVTPSNPAPGNPVSYSVTVRNFSGGALSAVRVSDPLPGGMTALASPTPSISGAGCASALTSDLSVPSTPTFTFDMTSGTGGAASQCVVTFSAMVPGSASVGATLTNTIPIGNVRDNNGAGGVANTGAASVNLTPINTAPMSKAFSPSSLSEGSISQLTITLTNNSANVLTVADLTDPLPSVSGPPIGQVVVASPANVSTTCGGSPTLTASPGASSVRVQNATVPARGSCVLRVNVTGPAGVYTNTIPANALQGLATVDGVPNTSVTYPNAVTAPITFTSALSAVKSFSPTVIQQNGRSRVSVRLSNTGSGTLNNVSVTDPLPSGMTVANPPSALTTCGGAPAITAVTGASTATLSGVVLPSGGTCDFQFDVVDTNAAASINSIPAGNITADGGVRNISAVSATLNKSAGGINVSKSTTPNTLTSPGQVSVLTITLLNTSPGVLTGVALNDYFTVNGLVGGAANGMRIAAIPGLTTTCPGGLPAATVGGTQVTMTDANLAASGSAGDSCTVSVNVTSTQIGTLTNTIPPGNVTSTQGVSNVGPAVTSLATLGNIGVEKSFAPAVIEPGQRARMRLNFINPLAVPLTNLAVTDNLPTGMVVPAGANPVTTCTGGTFTAPTTTQVVLANGTLPAASAGVSTSCYAEIDVTAASPGAYTNVILRNSVTASAGGTPVSNPPPDTAATLQVRSPVTLAKAFSPTSRLQGQVSTLTITLTNPNAIPLTGAVLRDNLPSGLAIALTPNASTTCTASAVNVSAPASATRIILSGATLPASGACTVQVDVVSNVSGSYVNTIPANALTTEEGVTNAEAATATVVYANPPTISKQFNPVSINSGGTSVLTLLLGNDNAAAITLTANLDDTLPTAPGNLVVATPNGLSTTCPGAVTATAGSGLVRYANGAQIPAGGCSISVNVTAAVDGTYNNYIPAGALQTSDGNNVQPAPASLVVSPLGYVSGRVFRDNNVVPNGTYQSGTDTPISGVTLTLSGTDYGADGAPGGGDDSAVSQTTTTDALGNYAFTGLNAGSYTVTEPSQPAATTNGITSAGSVSGGGGGTAGVATALATTPSAISNVVLLRSGLTVASSPNNNFAEIVPSSISGTVFLDQNNNGAQNGADSGISAVVVTLSGTDVNGNPVTASTTTDANGNYSFTGLQPGTYTVTEPTQPPSTANGITTAGTVANGGTAGTATAPGTTPSRIANIVLPPNTAATGNNFAEIANGRRISGTVFLDYDNSGTLNGSDHGLGGQTVNLSGTDINGNPVSATTTTASDGSYAFTGLPEGTYTINQPGQPAGTTNGTPTAGSTGGTATNPTATSSRIANVNLTGSNTVSGDNNFAEQVSAPDLAIAKSHSPTAFAAGNANFYTLAVSNVGNQPTSGTITVTDTLPSGVTLFSASGTGWSCSGSTTVVCTSSAVVAGGANAAPITLRVTVATGLSGQLLTNTATVSGGGEPPGFDGNNTATDIAAVADAASIAGTVWTDIDHDRVLDVGEPLMAGWTVELVLNGSLLTTTTTNASGAYSFPGLAPGSGYQVRFRHPGTGQIFGNAVPNEGGASYTSGVAGGNNLGGAATGDGTLSGITLVAGQNLVAQSLPLDPSGVVYDAVTRAPVAGAVVTISGPGGFNPATHLVSGSATTTTAADGMYQFLLNPSAPAGVYTLTVSTYPAGYLPSVSTLVAPCTGPVVVGAAPSPALIQDAITPPASSEAATCPGLVGGGAANSTQYYFSFTLTPGTSANVVNNHIPLDPILGGAIVMTKTTPLLNVNRGDLVPYTITATNTLSAMLSNINVDDLIPPGFRYRSGTTTYSSSVTPGSTNLEPVVNGRDLLWRNQTFAAGEKKTWKMMLVIGAGVGEGEYTNQVWALNSVVNSRVSNVASATVRVVPDPNFDCSDIIGKVFDDKNANGYQDQGEPGIANVRIATPRGLLVTTDSEGRFHVTCADVPNQDHGSNFVMKLDERTLPSGYRVTTENPRDVRLTRGKMVKLNFGATVHRVVRLELSGAAFSGDGVELQAEWAKQLQAVPAQLKGRPSVLRIAYRNGAESPDLARQRLDAVAARIRELWQQQESKDEEKRNPLVIETELEGAK